MREIKFRGLTTDGKWVYGWYSEEWWSCENKLCSTITPIGKSHSYQKLVIPSTVGEYTGLNDKNGVEIYIGDVYVYQQPLVEKGRQIYKAHRVVVKDEIPELFYLKNRSECSRGGVEVIGSIHQNPELLSRAEE